MTQSAADRDGCAHTNEARLFRVARQLETFEALLKKLRTLAPEMLELNGVRRRSQGIVYRVLAERHESAKAA
jgi:hypothetical protein